MVTYYSDKPKYSNKPSSKNYMSEQADILPNWLSHEGIILGKGQLNHSYTFWTMLIWIFRIVWIIRDHPLHTHIAFAVSPISKYCFENFTPIIWFKNCWYTYVVLLRMLLNSKQAIFSTIQLLFNTLKMQKNNTIKEEHGQFLRICKNLSLFTVFFHLDIP